ncbi:extracellular serine-rich protein [Rutstroemia sp. NJR-2017a BVV2]|nr:extracellular serine-rich protein [Rutstroemia sp. NJR-2017a BVV2]PQE18440.1 extracellular serine-rich protein [Rutstroemia sp. NJR-2017a BVV2]
MSWFALLFRICAAQTPTTSAPPVPTHTVSVGAEGLSFTPNQLNANISDVIEFRFYPQNHSVARAEYGRPCIPYEVTGVNKQGFWSGFRPINVVLSDGPKFQVVVNDTSPIFFYCSAPGACINEHMIGVVNPNATETLEGQIASLQNSSIQFSPGENFPVEALPSSTSSTTASSTTTSPTSSSTTLPTTVTESATPSPFIVNATTATSSGNPSPGAIAGIVIGAAAVVLLASCFLYLCGRQLTIKEIIHNNARLAPHPHSTTSYMPASLSSGTPTFPYKSPRHDVHVHGLGAFSPHVAPSHEESASASYRSRSPDGDLGIPPLNIGGQSPGQGREHAHGYDSRGNRSPSYGQGPLMTPATGPGSPGFGMIDRDLRFSTTVSTRLRSP